MEQMCSQCGKSLPLTTEFYAKYSSKDNKFELVIIGTRNVNNANMKIKLQKIEKMDF